MLLRYTLVIALVFPAIVALENPIVITGITCKNFPGPYTYSRPKVLRADGTCEMEDYTTTGPLAPLTDPMMHIFRGPARIERFMVYKPRRDYEQESVSTSKHPSPSWARVANYDSKEKIAEGVTFLSNNKFTSNLKLGFMPGYVGSDGKSLSNSPQVLQGIIPDNHEVILTSDRLCSNINPCGSTAPGSVSYHGWGGDRVVIARFTFPDSGCTAVSGKCLSGPSGSSSNWNKPAWWSLADTIIHNLQYGTTSCNAWKNGAGELDIHEVLEVGGNQGVLSFHMGSHFAGSAPRAFARPFSKPMTMAVIISQETFHVQVLDDSINLGKSLTNELVRSWNNDTTTEGNIIVDVSRWSHA